MAGKYVKSFKKEVACRDDTVPKLKALRGRVESMRQMKASDYYLWGFQLLVYNNVHIDMCDMSVLKISLAQWGMRCQGVLLPSCLSCSHLWWLSTRAL